MLEATRNEARRSLALPKSVDSAVIRWDYVASIVVIHLLAMCVLIPWLFSWTGLAAMVLGVNVFGQLGVPIGYHRLLTHRSFRVPQWLERTFVVIALCCAQDTPARWVSWHRKHHQHSDEQDDPHSPLVTFFWSHVGWLFVDNHETLRVAAYDKYARDILRDPFYMYLEKHRSIAPLIYLGHGLLFFLAGLTIGWAATGQAIAGLQFGLSLLVWGVLLRTVYVWHITWAVNSLTHMFGYRNFATDDDSRNNWFVAFITGGEGWHNNHHHDPTSASVQRRWYEFDLNYYFIRALKWAGLASDVVLPKHLRAHASASVATAAAGGDA
ncbi:MAG TPA: fatty acid desaturase [Pirellulales bacterium]|nr:fatty acid desaturase [Pirellulales bacterium]